jgi:hypothetical protein
MSANEQRGDRPSVFLGSSVEGLGVARALARHLERFATVTLWSEGAFHVGKTTIESLSEVADRSDFAVFVFTADDVLFARGASPEAVRINLIFELGFLAGRMGLSRTFIVSESHGISLPSDLAGVTYVSFSRQGTENVFVALTPAAAAIRRVIAQSPPRVEQPTTFLSCFISYTWNDKEFSAQLYDDLQSVGVRCWLDSVTSGWVRTEITNALALEDARRKAVLFPIRLDDAVFHIKGIPELEQLKERYIIDFSNWQDKRSYQRSFSKLVRDLAISTSVESGAR